MSTRHRLPSLVVVLHALLATVTLAAPPRNPVRPGAAVNGARELRTPVGVALTADRVYVADFDNDRVQVLSRAGEPLFEWGSSGSEPGQFRGPAGITIAADGTVLVTDLYNRRIQRFTGDGTLVGTWSAGAEGVAPWAVAVDRAGGIYVTDLDGDRVLSWSGDGSLRAAWGGPGRGPGELREPWGIAIDGQGDVLVADHGNHRIQRFSSDGRWLGAWGTAGTGEGELVGPMGLAIGPDGSIWVTDLVPGRIQRFARDGTLRTTLRAPGVGASPAPLAWGIALDDAGEVYVADASRHRVERLSSPLASADATAGRVPAAFDVTAISPVPGNGTVTLRLSIPSAGALTAEVFSIEGRRVHVMPSAPCEAGDRRITWDARDGSGRPVPTGVYFVRVHFDDGVRRLSRATRVIVLR